MFLLPEFLTFLEPDRCLTQKVDSNVYDSHVCDSLFVPINHEHGHIAVFSRLFSPVFLFCKNSWIYYFSPHCMPFRRYCCSNCLLQVCVLSVHKHLCFVTVWCYISVSWITMNSSNSWLKFNVSVPNFFVWHMLHVYYYPFVSLNYDITLLDKREPSSNTWWSDIHMYWHLCFLFYFIFSYSLRNEAWSMWH